MALLKSSGSWGWVIALAGFASGYGTNAAAQLLEAPAAAPAARAAVSSAPRISGAEQSALGQHVDVRSEAAEAALSSGSGSGGKLLQPLPAL